MNKPDANGVPGLIDASSSPIRPSLRRRTWLAMVPALLCTRALALPPKTIQFPRDHGAHPELRSEWWYITGHLGDREQREFGFQVTFFRTRLDRTQHMASRFAAKQLIFAHAAVTDVQGRRLLHDQRIARAGFGIADALQADTQVQLRDWSLRRDSGVYRAHVPAGDFALELQCAPTQAVLLQGEQGLSRKGPEEKQASYYYSLPQLAVIGRLSLAGRTFEVRGRAWLDHEWSEELMHPDAVGWDWIGMNFDDGSALTAFRLRRKDGSALWDGGSFRSAGGATRAFAVGETAFEPQRRWTSPLSGSTYPVEWRVRTPAGEFAVKAAIDAQELDSRASTGAIYWEGLSDLLDAEGRRVAQGYLEMTGYAQPLRM